MELFISILKTIGIALGFVFAIAAIKKFIAEPIFSRIFPKRYYKSAQGFFIIVVQLIIYYLVCRYVFDTPFWGNNVIFSFAAGLAAGGILITLSIIVSKVMGIYKFERNSKFLENSLVGNLVIAVIFFLLLALFEEIVFRGMLYTGLRQQFSMLWTVIITTVIFVLPHLKNKGINIFSVVSLILAGVLLNLLREYSGNIWMPFGFHFVWNFVQGILGFNVSGGNEMTALFDVTTNGRTYLNGGKFGIEASLITIVFLIAFVVLTIMYVVVSR